MSASIREAGICEIENISYPAVGFGTYPSRGEACKASVNEAARVGYRIIDTATFYENLEPIGEALKEQGRKNFYLISKVWPSAHTPSLLRQDLALSLKKLETDYLDAYLLHWPNSQVSIEETLGAMDEARVKGEIRHIGLSNVTVNHLRRALEVGVPITWVQVEMHPFFYDAELLAFCREKNIIVQAWAPLARGKVNQDASLAQLGKKYGKNSAQIAIRWILQHHCLPLPASQNPVHIQENFQVMDFVLSDEDMHAMNERASRGQRERITQAAGIGYTDEFDFSYAECWPK